jgi:hypothetical protein
MPGFVRPGYCSRHRDTAEWKEIVRGPAGPTEPATCRRTVGRGAMAKGKTVPLVGEDDPGGAALPEKTVVRGSRTTAFSRATSGRRRVAPSGGAAEPGRRPERLLLFIRHVRTPKARGVSTKAQ